MLNYLAKRFVNEMEKTARYITILLCLSCGISFGASAFAFARGLSKSMDLGAGVYCFGFVGFLVGVGVGLWIATMIFGSIAVFLQIHQNLEAMRIHLEDLATKEKTLPTRTPPPIPMRKIG